MDLSKPQEILKQSGNSFHSRVVNMLREGGWHVLVSPHYSDNFTDKPREIDIISEKKFDVHEFPNEWVGTVNARLVIECKYIKEDTVFWFDDKDMVRAEERIKRDTGMERGRDSGAEKHHYHLPSLVAKLFASDSNRKEDNEAFTKAINQVLNSTVYYRNHGEVRIVPIHERHVSKLLKRISYPLIVVNSFEHFYATKMSSAGELESIIEPFQLEVNYAYPDSDGGKHNEYFLIDVVSFEKLPEFLTDLIEKGDVEGVIDKVQWDRRSRPNAGSSDVYSII